VGIHAIKTRRATTCFNHDAALDIANLLRRSGNMPFAINMTILSSNSISLFAFFEVAS
jgi:hypothetical protein